MKFAVAGLMLLAAVAQANILTDILHTIEKPLESLAESALGSLLGGGGLSAITSLFGKREVTIEDIHALEGKLREEAHHWLGDAYELVQHELQQVEEALVSPDAHHGDRVEELIGQMTHALEHGDIAEFIGGYSREIIEHFARILPTRLQHILLNHEQGTRKLRSNDILLQLMKDISVAHWFFALPEAQRQFFVALLDATEHGHLHDFVEKHTYDRVLAFIDHMPAEDGHKLNHYLSQHLNHETHNNTTQEHNHPKRDMNEFIKILQEMYAEHIYSLISQEDRVFLLELMAAAEHDKLTEFIGNRTLARVEQFIASVPKESGDKLSKFITQHLKNESHLQHPHRRDANVLLKILKDIHNADVFFHLPEDERNFMLELMDAAENGHLDDFVHKVGVQRVRNFVKHLPEDYGTKMTHYIQNHLHHHENNGTSVQSFRRDASVLLVILKDIHSADVFFHLPEAERNFMLELMDAAEHGHLDDFVHKVGLQRVRDFVKHLPGDYATHMTHYIQNHLHHHMNNGTGTDHHKRAETIMLDILKNIHTATIFFELPEAARHLLLDLLDAAEHGHLTEKLVDHGMNKLEAFLDHLPEPHSSEFEKYIIGHLKQEINHGSHSHTKRNDAILMVLLNNIHTAGIFFHLPESERLYLLDLMDAAEHGHTVHFIGKEGLERLEEFLTHMPKEYATPISAYVTTHLSQEIIANRNNTNTTPATQVKRAHQPDHTHTDHNEHHPSHHHTIHETLDHVKQHMTDHHEQFKDNHHHIYDELKHAIDHHQLRAFIEKIGTTELYDFLDALPDHYAREIEQHILTELEKEDNVNINY